MKKIIMSFAIMASLTTVSTACAETSPTVLYFHDKHDQPIKDFPFIININETQQSLNALDDGYKVIDDAVSVIEIAGEQYSVIPGELNNIEVMNPEEVIPSPEDMVVTEHPLSEDDLTIKVHVVDRAYSLLEDGITVYLTYDGEIVEEAETTNGIVTFNIAESGKIYDVSFNKDADESVKIEAGEAKYLIFEGETKPIKRERTVESAPNDSRLNNAVRKSPDDIPPLLSRSRKEDTSKESAMQRESSRTRKSENSSAKPQLPVKQPTVNPMKRNGELSVSSNTSSYTRDSYSSESENDLSSNNYSSTSMSEDNATTSYSTEDTSQQNTSSSEYASDSSYASDRNYNDYRKNSTADNSSSESKNISNETLQRNSNRVPITNSATLAHTKSTDNEDQYLPQTGEAMSLLLPLAGIMTITAGVALLYFTRKKRNDDVN